MSSEDIPQPHDSLVRHTFGQVEHAASFFRENLKPALASAIRWDKLELISGSFVDENLRQSQSDLLYRVPLIEQADSADGETSILLYLLFEHQSTPDRWMPLRVLRYECQIWQRYIDEHPAAAGLPPIVPLVLAQVAGGWKISPHFRDQVVWPTAPQVRAALELHQPQFEHALVDLAGIDLHALRGDLIARLTQGLLKVRVVDAAAAIVAIEAAQRKKPFRAGSDATNADRAMEEEREFHADDSGMGNQLSC